MWIVVVIIIVIVNLVPLLLEWKHNRETEKVPKGHVTITCPNCSHTFTVAVVLLLRNHKVRKFTHFEDRYCPQCNATVIIEGSVNAVGDDIPDWRVTGVRVHTTRYRYY